MSPQLSASVSFVQIALHPGDPVAFWSFSAQTQLWLIRKLEAHCTQGNWGL